MYISRTAGVASARLARDYPVVAITGPRQSGKTTLARHVFPDKAYVSLEDLDERGFAEEDPRGFLERFPDGAILDEVQRVPSLFSYLQTLVDQDGRTGLFILTGSHQFDQMTGITQSLAGRVALLKLLPLSLGELQSARRDPDDLDRMLYLGHYPAVHDRSLDASTWYGNYIRTYIERDLRQIISVQNLQTFQRFVKLCAGWTGQLLNLSSLASAAGVTHPTARSWISVLEASYIIHLLQPHHRNFNKRIIKTPKLYFYDTGVVCRLLGIDTPEQVATHPLRGALVETWVIAELLKGRLHRADRANLYFWRDRGGNEVDVVIEEGDRLLPIEIKSGATAVSDFADSLRRWSDLAGDAAGEPYVIYGGGQSMRRSGVDFVGWRDLPASPIARARR